MRILFLTSELPYPPDSGGRLKTHAIIEYLRRDHQLAILCFQRRPLTGEQERWAAEVGDVRTVALNRGRDPLTFLRSYLAGVPLSIQRNRAGEMSALVTEWRPNEFDAIFIDHWLMAQYLPADFTGLKLLHEHNAEYLIWEREAAAAGNPVTRLLLEHECRRVRDYEQRILGLFDVVFAVSDPDRDALINLGAPAGRIYVLPNIPDERLLAAPALSFAGSEPLLIFLGTLSWKPNIGSAERLLTRVFPAVRARLPDARFLLAGRGAPTSLKALAARTPGVEFVSDTPDPEAFYRRARVFVEGTTTGGGTKLKVLNALARGLPVVASPEGAAGLEITQGQDAVIANDDDRFADSVVRLLSDEDMWRRFSEGARALIRKKYLADTAFRTLEEALLGVVTRG